MELERLPLHSTETEGMEISPSALDTRTGPDTIVALSATPDANLNGTSDPSDSESDSDSDSLETEDSSNAVKTYSKRQRSRPVKYDMEFSPSNISAKAAAAKPEASETASNTPGEEPKPKRRRIRKKREFENPPQVPPRLRGKGCGKCKNCTREDCGKCAFCLDKVKFGGPGKKKQKCLLRACLNFEHKRPIAVHSQDAAASPQQQTIMHYVGKAVEKASG